MTHPTRAELAVAGGVFLLCFAVYSLSHGAGPFWQESGLFVAGLKIGAGLAPPGYPLYLLLGRPFVALFQIILPGRPFAEGVNAFSAVWAALTAALVAFSVALLLRPGFRFF